MFSVENIGFGIGYRFLVENNGFQCMTMYDKIRQMYQIDENCYEKFKD